MKKILLIISLIILNLPNSYGQCLCGKFEIQINFDNLNFSNGNSNYELNFLEKPNFIQYPEGLLKENAFSKDTLKVVLPTSSGIQKLVIQIKNIVTKSTMNLTMTDMTYDNDYLIDLSKFASGNYVFDWKKIDSCQSLNRKSKIVECKEMKFAQLNLNKTNSKFNHNKIKVLDLKYFLKKENNSTQIKKNEIKERIESLFSSEVDSIYHLEKGKYLFTQRKVSGNGNHYYDEIKMRIISFSENKITLYPIDIETNENNGYLDENGCLIISQHQLFDFNDKMSVNFDKVTRTLSYQFHSMNIDTWETATFIKFEYIFMNGNFELISEKHKEVKL